MVGSKTTVDITTLSGDELNGVLRVLYSQISAIKAQFNTRCPIGRLFPEILSAIFQAIVDDWSLTIEGMENGDHIPYDWLVITHVCSYWRNVAIETSTLWSHIVLHKDKLIKLMLKRSRRAALSLYCWDDLSLDPDLARQRRIFDFISPHLPRVERMQIVSLWLDLLPPHSFPHLLFAHHLPSIRFISLKDVGGYAFYRLPDIENWAKQKRISPKSYRFENLSAYTAEALVGSSLLHLSMTRMAGLDLLFFVSILVKCPQLESLVCVSSDFIHFESDGYFPTLVTATLPQLRFLKLELGADLEALSTLLQHISHPTATSVYLACSALPSSANYYVEENTGNYLRNIIPKNITDLTIEANFHDLVVSSVDFALRLRIIVPRESQSPLISCLLSYAVPKTLCHLGFEAGLDSFGRDVWKRTQVYKAIQKNAPNLQWMILPSIYHLTNLLLYPINDENPTSARSIPFPKLRKLWIDKMGKEEILTLYNVLQTRRRWGNVLDKVYMPYPQDTCMYDAIARYTQVVFIS